MYSNQYFDRQINLHCRISSPIFELLKDESISFKGLFYTKLSQGIQITKNEINDIFDISKDIDFDICLNIKSIILSPEKDYISVIINNVEHKIDLVFKYPEIIAGSKGELYPNIKKYNIKKYNFYYELQTDELVKIDQSTKIDNNFAILSPFNSKQIKQPQIKYSGDCSIVNSKDNIFVYLSSNGEMNIKQENKIHTDLFIKKIVNKYNTPLFGINQNEWYPTFDVYCTKLKEFQILDITKENNEKAKKMFKEIHFTANVNCFEKFASILFMNKEMTHGIKNIINHELLKCFKEIFIIYRLF